MRKKEKLIFSLFVTFFKIGAFTFGGGYAMLPLIQREACENKGWLSKEELLTLVAVAESTPGPIAVNAATFVGYRTAGFLGAALATCGVVLPAFGIITALSFIPANVTKIPTVSYALFGLRAGVAALILRALWNMYRACPKGIFSYVVMAAAFLLVGGFHVGAVWVLLGCAAAGIVYSLWKRRDADALS